MWQNSLTHAKSLDEQSLISFVIPQLKQRRRKHEIKYEEINVNVEGSYPVIKVIKSFGFAEILRFGWASNFIRLEKTKFIN